MQQITDINSPQTAVYGPLDEQSTTAYYNFWDNLVQNNLEQMDRIVQTASDLATTVIFDVHNYDQYDGQLITDKGEALANFWRKLATRYQSADNVIFGLMNEPHSELDIWVNHANAAIAAIRDTSATQPILVAFQNTSVQLNKIQDPLNNVLWEVHQYIDEDYSGTHPQCVNRHRFIERLSRVTAMFRSFGAKAFLGEFGAGDVYESNDSAVNQVCHDAVRAAIAYLSKNNDVWHGYSW